MIIRLAISFVAAVLGCVSPAGTLDSPAPPRQPGASDELFAAAVSYLAERAQGRLLVDPRPLRPGADLGAVQNEDLAPDADAVARLRAEALAERGIAITNAVADFRCTFSVGVGLPPEREAALPDSIRQRTRECRARPPYTTLIVSLPEAGDAEPAGTRRMEAVAMTLSGFQIWELYLRPAADGTWQVTDARTRLNIRS